MAECVECGSYTNYNGGLCKKCYSERHNHYNTAYESEQEETVGLSDKERSYRYSMIKGRIAETLIQELFLSLGYNVFRYGMENTVPGIMELLKGVRSDVAQEIRRMPDFVVQNPETNRITKKIFFII